MVGDQGRRGVEGWGGRRAGWRGLQKSIDKQAMEREAGKNKHLKKFHSFGWGRRWGRTWRGMVGGMNAEELQGALNEAVGPQCPAAWQGWVTMLALAGKQGKPVGVNTENYG